MNSKVRAALPMLLDLLVPVVGYFALHAVGFDDFWALTIAGGLTAVHALVTTVRRRRLDALGTLVVLEIALSVVLLFATRDPRIVLLKPSFYTALAGVYLLYTCIVGRPFLYDVCRPFATRGDAAMERDYDNAWTHRAGLRSEMRLLTVGWAALWLVESVVRAVVVLNTTVEEGVLASQVPGIAAILIGIAFTRMRVPALRRHVEAARVKTP